MTRTPTWAEWPPFRLVATENVACPHETRWPWTAVSVHDASRETLWPFGAVHRNFELQISNLWAREQQGHLRDFGLSHRDLEQWIAETERIARHWMYSPETAAVILTAAGAVRRTVERAEAHGPAGDPWHLRQRTLSALLWGFHRLRMAVKQTAPAIADQWGTVDWADYLAPGRCEAGDAVTAGPNAIHRAITRRIERFSQRVRHEDRKMSAVLSNVLHNALIDPSGAYRGPRYPRTPPRKTCMTVGLHRGVLPACCLACCKTSHPLPSATTATLIPTRSGASRL